LENIPKQGAALLISNHLGDADLVLGLAFSPVIIEIVSKIELAEIPILGSLLQAYGIIWVRRGQPDRKALRAILQGLKEGRMVGIAPEGRESLTGSLEEGTGGAAYLALKADVPLIPVTFTGTENRRVFDNIKHFRRTNVSMTIGPPFRLENLPDWREAVTQGTKTIMQTLARQLPPAYRGVYEIEVREQSERV
jgi:1-acyl-sn-glycerol-3-phosphate acyltransferase